MKNYIVKQTDANLEVFLDDAVVATFTRDLNGMMTYMFMLRGLSTNPNTSVYEEFAQRYAIGHVGQLDDVSMDSFGELSDEFISKLKSEVDAVMKGKTDV